MTPKQMDALNRILEYLEHDEEKDWIEQSRPKSGHVYLDVLELRDMVAFPIQLSAVHLAYSMRGIQWDWDQLTDEEKEIFGDPVTFAKCRQWASEFKDEDGR